MYVWMYVWMYGVCLSMEGTTNTWLFFDLRQPFRVEVRDKWIQEYDEVAIKINRPCPSPSAASAQALSLLAEPRVADAVKVLGNDPFLPTQAFPQSWENAENDVDVIWIPQKVIV